MVSPLFRPKLHTDLEPGSRVRLRTIRQSVRKRTLRLLPTALLSALMLFPSVGFGQEKTEGTVVSTKLTACQFKPGGCEGYLTLETKGTAKTEQVTIKVALGTPIKKGNETAYLPALRGKLVAVSYVTDKGEKLAKSIDVLEAKR